MKSSYLSPFFWCCLALAGICLVNSRTLRSVCRDENKTRAGTAAERQEALRQETNSVASRSGPGTGARSAGQRSAVSPERAPAARQETPNDTATNSTVNRMSQRNGNSTAAQSGQSRNEEQRPRRRRTKTTRELERRTSQDGSAKFSGRRKTSSGEMRQRRGWIATASYENSRVERTRRVRNETQVELHRSPERRAPARARGPAPNSTAMSTSSAPNRRTLAKQRSRTTEWRNGQIAIGATAIVTAIDR